MSIKKSLGLGLVLGLLAMAFAALPAMASAAPSLTSPKETLVAVGTTITATSTNAETELVGLGNLKCEKVVINGIVEKNNGSEVLVGMDGENDTATGCKLAGTAVAVKPTFESLKLTASSKTANFTFTVTGGISEKSESTVSYVSGSTSIHVQGPVGGTNTGTFKGDFTAVVKSTGKSVIFD